MIKMVASSLELKSFKTCFLFVLLAHIFIIGLFIYHANNTYFKNHTLKATLISNTLPIKQTFSNVQEKTTVKTNNLPNHVNTSALNLAQHSASNVLTASSSSKGIHASSTQLANPKPPYPTLSRKLGEEGTVYLSVVIHPNGHVNHVGIHKTSGFKRLDLAALKTVKQWHFVANKTQSYTVIQPIHFSLKE